MIIIGVRFKAEHEKMMREQTGFGASRVVPDSLELGTCHGK
jgi:hypothetical protein